MQCIETADVFILNKLVAAPVLQVIGEADHLLGAPVERVDRIVAEIRDEEDRLFDDKLVHQGRFLLRVIFVGTDHHVYEELFEVPFSTEADVPGLRQGMAASVLPQVLLLQSDWRQLDAKRVIVKVVARIEVLITIPERRRLPLPIPVKPPRPRRVCRGAFEFKAVPCHVFSTCKCC